MTSHPTNPDHNTVSYNLLSEVFHALNKPDEEAACLSAVILNHPLLPHLWARMARVYFQMSKNEMSQTTEMSRDKASSIQETSEAELQNNEGSSQKSENDMSSILNVRDMSIPDVSGEDDLSVVHPSQKDTLRLRHLAAGCLFRSLLLLKSVQKSVSDFVRVKNLSSQKKIELELEEMNLDPNVSKKILELVSKNLKNDELASDDVIEFEDLGKSVRMKALEESFKKLDSSLEFDPSSISLPSLSSFEQKMLSYLDESKWTETNKCLKILIFLFFWEEVAIWFLGPKVLGWKN